MRAYGYFLLGVAIAATALLLPPLLSLLETARALNP